MQRKCCNRIYLFNKFEDVLFVVAVAQKRLND